MFSLICVWINVWVNNGEAGDLRRHRGHYDVIVTNHPSIHSFFHPSISPSLHPWHRFEFACVMPYLVEIPDNRLNLVEINNSIISRNGRERVPRDPGTDEIVCHWSKLAGLRYIWKHHGNVTWASWQINGISNVRSQSVQINNQWNNKVPLYCPSVRLVHRSPMDSPRHMKSISMFLRYHGPKFVTNRYV